MAYTAPNEAKAGWHRGPPTLAAVAANSPSTLSNMISPVTSTSNPLDFDVTWVDGSGTQRVDLALTRGDSSAYLSGDYDASGAEVWVSVMEQAFFQEIGLGTCSDGGTSEIIPALAKTTGAGSYTSFSGLTNVNAESIIRDNFGKAMVIASYDDAQVLSRKHALAVLRIDEDGNRLVVWDPRSNGGEVRTILFSEMVQNIQGVFIGQ